MALHIDLVRQARRLARQEPRRPLQASLRRSISASYYAIFHLLIDAATKRMVTGPDRSSLRGCLGRAFGHAEMKTVALQFANRSLSPKLKPGLNDHDIQKEIVRIAETFVDLQQARHEADYNIDRIFTRREAIDFADRANNSIVDWRMVQNSVQADTFLVGMLAFKNMRA